SKLAEVFRLTGRPGPVGKLRQTIDISHCGGASAGVEYRRFLFSAGARPETPCTAGTMDTTHLDSGPGRRGAPAAPRPADPAHELRNLGEFRILRLLGEGGMGAVYLGYREADDRQVAVKVLADHLASNQAFVDRFYREAKSGALLNHPNIVRSIAI